MYIVQAQLIRIKTVRIFVSRTQHKQLRNQVAAASVSHIQWLTERDRKVNTTKS